VSGQCWSVHGISTVSYNANVQSAAGNIEQQKLDWDVQQADFARYENLYKVATITKQQYEQA
jgi:multidrug resistance efflux pump